MYRSFVLMFILLRVSADNLPYEKVGKNDPVCIADEVPFEIPESWEWVRLYNLGANINDAFADGPFGSNLKKEHYTSERQVRLIQLSNIGEEGWRNDNIKYTTYEHAKTLARSMVKPGYIVIAKMMPAGRAIIVPDIENDFILSSDAVKFIPHDTLNKEYLILAINSPTFRNQVVSEAHGVTRIRTSLGKLQTYLLPIPPIEEQRRIVDKIKNVYENIGRYEETEKKRENLNISFPDQLKKSILQQAVMGKLVPQDENDELASVLLERIQAEKEMLIKAGKLKKDKHESIIYRRDNSHYEKLDGIERCIDDEIPYSLPENWQWARLGELTCLLSGTDFRPEQYNDRKEGIPYITGASNLGDAGVIVNRWTACPQVIAEKGDVLIVCKGSGYGKTITCDVDKAHIARQIMAFRRMETLNMDYLKCFLAANFDILKSRGQGVIPGIDRNSVLSLLFPLPPLSEQKRIVLKISQLLPLCNSL